MTTSGTYNFAPSMGEMMLYAFNIAGLRNTSLTQEHINSARMASNLMLGRWSADGVNLWQVDLQTVPFVQGQSTYTVPGNTIAILDVYMTITSGSSTTNRILMPISRSEYASYPNPQEQGTPTVYWFDRLIAGTITIWMVPDGTQTSFSYYRLRQNQDSNFTSGQTVDIPEYWLEAYADGLAYRLAKIWNPSMAVALKAQADESYGIAARQNEETANFYVTPIVASYFRP